MKPKPHKVGWYDEDNQNYGHSENMTGEEAELLKEAMKAEHGDKYKVVIFPPMQDQEQKRRR